MTALRPVAIALALVAVAGCQRAPRFVPEDRDSTAHVVDSVAIRMREVQAVWEGGAGAEAAAATARLLSEVLGRHLPSEWRARAAVLLDSLGVGAELADGPCALAVNLFSRASPGSDSWPYLFWCGEGARPYQALEGRDLRLSALATRGLEGGAGGARGAAAIFTRRSPEGRQPMLMTWLQAPGSDRWRLVQTLGPDSLGGAGTGEFEALSDTTIDMVARTFRTPRYFEECATCPHVYRIHRFRWGASGFHRVEDVEVPSTYSTFVRFIHALVEGDREAAERLVTARALVDAARRLDWDKRMGAWRVAPGTEETPSRIEFFRGPKEAYRVHFEPRGEDWLIAGFEPAPRSLE